MQENKSGNDDVVVDILSFDGGGSKGVMEAYILNDVMRLATILIRNPAEVRFLLNDKENMLTDLKVREKLNDCLNNVTDPIHPTEIYEMIVGTSTGALIAFGLVGGNVDENGKRKPMSLDEIITMYLEKTKDIFAKTWSKWFSSFIPGLSKAPITTYPQENVSKVLLEQFGDCTMSDFHDIEGKRCVAGAVSKQLGQNEQLVLFDTACEDYMFYSVAQVLLATTNAPVYFQTPVSIGNNLYVDGGVGGNCPLLQAMPRARDIFGPPGKVKITSALSVAPPKPKSADIPDYLQIKYWMNYFVEQSTDGYAVYKEALKKKDKDTLFQRLAPRGESLKNFKLDEINVQRMLDAVTKEKLNNEMFLVDVISSAVVVAYTSINKSKNNVESAKVCARLAYYAGNSYFKNKEYVSAINSYETGIKLLELDGKEKNKKTLSEIYKKIANCLRAKGEYHKAIKLYITTITFFTQTRDYAEVIETSHALVDCYLSLFQYDKAKDVLNELLKLGDEYDLVETYSYMAWCQQELGNLEEAFKYYIESLKMQSEENDLKAETLNNLGLCFADLNMLPKALEKLEESLSIRRILKNTSKIAESLNNLGWCYSKHGEYKEAARYLQEALKMISKDDETILVGVILENSAECFSQIDNHRDALEYVQQALAIKQKIVGNKDNPGIAKTLYVTGFCFLKSGKHETAREFLYKSYRIMKRLTKVDNHPNLLKWYTSLSELHETLGNKEAANHNETKASAIRESIEKMKGNVQNILNNSNVKQYADQNDES